MKKTLLAATIVSIMLVLAGCCRNHKWVDATCSEAKHCSKCGKVEGFPLQHKWKEATCTEPKTCEYCGLTEGEAKGHAWKSATFDEPKTCTECGITEGEKVSCKEMDLSAFKKKGITDFRFLEKTVMCWAEDKDDMYFCDYDGNVIATVNAVPPNSDEKRVSYYFIAPPNLKTGVVFAAIYYGPGEKRTFTLYDEFGKEVGNFVLEFDVNPNKSLTIRNVCDGRYLRICTTDAKDSYEALVVIDTQTMDLADINAGLNTLKRYSSEEYRSCISQATIDNKYLLVTAKDGSYVGYVDTYFNKVAFYKDATRFNYYGFALVSKEGEVYDVVNSNLETVGTGVLKGSNIQWEGDAVFSIKQNGETHYYSIK